MSPLLKLKFILLALIFGAFSIGSHALPVKPSLESPVNDYARLLSPEESMQLQRLLVDFADSTSNQICVVVVNNLEGMDISDYAINLGIDWKVGSERFDNGIVFLIYPKPGTYTPFGQPLTEPDDLTSGQAFIAVGKGLEGAIPDVYCYRIVNDVAIPCFAQGDYYGGIEKACLELMHLADSEYHSPYEEESVPIIPILTAWAIILLVIFWFLKKHGKGDDDDDKDNDYTGGGHRPIFWGPIFPRGRSGGGFGGFSGGGFSGGFGGGGFGGGGGGGRW